MKHFFNHSIKWSFYATASSIVLVALIFLSAHLGLDLLLKQRQRLEDFLERAVGYQVHFEKVDAWWEGAQPVIVFKNVDILSPETKSRVVNIKEFRLSLAILKSLFKRQLMMGPVFLKEINILEELKNEGDPQENFKSYLSWILLQPQIVLKDIHFKCYYLNKHRQVYLPEFQIVNSADTHYAYGSLVLTDEPSFNIQFNLKLKGHANALDNMRGTFYLAGEKLELNPWISGKAFENFSGQNGTASFKLWGKFNKKHILALHLLFQLNDFRLNASKAKSLNIQHASGNLLWRREKRGGWTFSGTDVRFKTDKYRWKPLQFAYHVNPKQDKKIFWLNKLNLKGINYFFEFFDIQKQVQSYWGDLSPVGSINNFILNIKGNKFQKENLSFGGELKDLALKPYKNIPAFSHLSTVFWVEPEKGYINIDSTDFKFYLSQLYNHPIRLDHLKANVGFYQKNKEIVFYIPKVLVETDGLELESSAQLKFLTNKQAPYIDLNVTVLKAEPSKLFSFAPTKILNESLSSWLQQALEKASGKIKAQMKLEGDLSDFPFKTDKGQFYVSAQMSNFAFNYAQGYPGMTHAEGKALFDSNHVEIELTDANIMGIRSNKVKADIRPFGKNPILRVDGYAYGDASQGFNFLYHSPLAGIFEKRMTGFGLSGPMDVHLKLLIPLSDSNVKTEVWGKASLENNILSHPKWGVKISDLTGELIFTESQLMADNLLGEWVDRPVKISIGTHQLNQNENIITIKAKSSIDLSHLSKYYSFYLPPFIHGETDIEASVKTSSAKQEPATVTFSSDLKGISIDMPQWLNKPANTLWPSTVGLQLASDNQDAQVNIDLNKDIKALLQFKTEPNFTFDKMSISLGSAEFPRLQEGIFLSAKLDTFDWKAWQDFYKKYFEKSNDDAGTILKRLARMDLNFDRLSFAKQDYSPIHLVVTQKPDAWNIVSSSKNLNGEISYPKNYPSTPLELNLNYINILKKKEDDNNLTPKAVPSLIFSARELQYGDRNFGEVKFTTIPQGNGVKIKDIKISNPSMALQSQAEWTEEGKQQYTQMKGSLVSINIKKLLGLWDIHSDINAQETRADFNLSWKDSLFNPSFGSLKGVFELSMRQGEIQDLGNSAAIKLGLGRIITLLSVESITKRLSLNFSDLKGNGYAFEKMHGNFKATNGNLITDDTQFHGIVAHIDLMGRIGVIKKDYDLELRVTPHLTSSLPIIATIAGGPWGLVAGAATWVVNKVVAKEVNKVVSYDYHMYGPWSAPQIQELK